MDPGLRPAGDKLELRSRHREPPDRDRPRQRGHDVPVRRSRQHVEADLGRPPGPQRTRRHDVRLRPVGKCFLCD